MTYMIGDGWLQPKIVYVQRSAGFDFGGTKYSKERFIFIRIFNVFVSDYSAYDDFHSMHKPQEDLYFRSLMRMQWEVISALMWEAAVCCYSHPNFTVGRTEKEAFCNLNTNNLVQGVRNYVLFLFFFGQTEWQVSDTNKSECILFI